MEMINYEEIFKKSDSTEEEVFIYNYFFFHSLTIP